jgi:hypothetical protein
MEVPKTVTKKPAAEPKSDDPRDAFVNLSELMQDLIKEWNITEKSKMIQTGGMVYHAYVRNIQTTMRRLLKPAGVKGVRLTEGKRTLNKI